MALLCLLCCHCSTRRRAAGTDTAAAGQLPPAPPAPMSSATETLHGLTIRDPFRALERRETALPWLAAQDARTTAYLDGLADRGLTGRVEQLLEIGFLGNPQLAGGRLFFIKKEGRAGQARLFVLDGQGRRLLVDPAAEGGARTTLEWYRPSPSGALVAYGLSRGGREHRSTLRVKRTDTGQKLDLAIQGARDGSVAFAADDSGFFYTRVIEPRALNRAVYYHRIGTDAGSDPQVFRRRPGRVNWPSVDLLADDRYLAIVAETSFTNTRVFLLDRRRDRLITLAAGLDASTRNLRLAGGALLALTDHEAPRGRIVAIDPAHPAPAAWRTVVAESDRVLQGFEVAGGRLVVRALQRGTSRLPVFDLRGTPQGEIPLAVPGTVDRLTVEPGRAVFSFTSFVHPDALLEVRLAERPWRPRPRVTLAAAGLVDSGAFVVRRPSYPSSDGTRVPLFLLYRRGLDRSRPAPTLLQGYGCYGRSTSPTFLADALVWAERGGIWALASIRGGGELGERWHRAGMKANKRQSFQDFEYAMRYLLREGITSVDRLAIEGSSCGGLLVGAMMTLSPHLFGCAIAHAGLYDLVRMHRFSDGKVHARELGDAENPAEIGYLWGYSPYHQVIPGVRYPALLATASENDPRVPWVHTAKLVAALQRASRSPRPILLRFNRNAGHGRGLTSRERVRALVESLKFALSRLDRSPPL